MSLQDIVSMLGDISARLGRVEEKVGLEVEAAPSAEAVDKFDELLASKLVPFVERSKKIGKRNGSACRRIVFVIRE